MFRRERGDDFFEARITAQRILVGIKTQVAVSCASRDFRENFELLKKQGRVPGHSTNHPKTIKRVPTIKGVFCDRHKHDSPACLLKRVFLSPKVSIDETKCTEGQADIRLRPHYLFLLRARGDKDSARRYGISYQQALASNSSIPDQCHVQNCVSAELIVFPEMTDTGYSMSVIQKNADEWNS